MEGDGGVLELQPCSFPGRSGKPLREDDSYAKARWSRGRVEWLWQNGVGAAGREAAHILGEGELLVQESEEVGRAAVQPTSGGSLRLGGGQVGRGGLTLDIFIFRYSLNVHGQHGRGT